VATNVLEIVLKARDEASAKLRAARTEVTKTQDVIGQLSPQLASTTARFEGLGRAAAAMGPVGAVLAAFGVSIAAVAAGAKIAIDAVDQLASATEQLGNLAQKSGVSVEQLQGLQFAFKNAGVEAGTLNTGLRFLARSIADGNPELARFGITTKNVGTAFEQLSDLFAGSEDGAEKTALAVALLGRAGSDLIPVLNQGSEALRQQQREAEAMGKVLGGPTLAALKNADTAIDEMKNRVEALKVQVTLLAVPAVTNLVEGLNGLLRAVIEIPSKVDAAGSSIATFVAKIPGGKRLQEFLAFVRALGILANASQGGEKTGFEGNIDPATGGPKGGVTGPKNVLTEPTPRTVHDSVLDQILSTDGAARLRESKKELLEVGKAVEVVALRFGELGESFLVLEDFQDMVDGVLDASNILGETLNAVWASLQDSLTSVFQGLLTQGQTFRGAMSQIFRGLVDTLLAELARLAAAAVFKLFLKLAGFALGGAPGAAIDAGTRYVHGGFAVAGGGGAAALAGVGPVTNVFVSALDSQSLDDSYRSSGGAFRIHDGRASARRRW